MWIGKGKPLYPLYKNDIAGYFSFLCWRIATWMLISGMAIPINLNYLFWKSLFSTIISMLSFISKWTTSNINSFFDSSIDEIELLGNKIGSLYLLNRAGPFKLLCINYCWFKVYLGLECTYIFPCACFDSQYLVLFP